MIRAFGCAFSPAAKSKRGTSGGGGGGGGGGGNINEYTLWHDYTHTIQQHTYTLQYTQSLSLSLSLFSVFSVSPRTPRTPRTPLTCAASSCP